MPHPYPDPLIEHPPPRRGPPRPSPVRNAQPAHRPASRPPARFRVRPGAPRGRTVPFGGRPHCLIAYQRPADLCNGLQRPSLTCPTSSIRSRPAAGLARPAADRAAPREPRACRRLAAHRARFHQHMQGHHERGGSGSGRSTSMWTAMASRTVEGRAGSCAARPGAAYGWATTVSSTPSAKGNWWCGPSTPDPAPRSTTRSCSRFRGLLRTAQRPDLLSRRSGRYAHPLRR